MAAGDSKEGNYNGLMSFLNAISQDKTIRSLSLRDNQFTVLLGFEPFSLFFGVVYRKTSQIVLCVCAVQCGDFDCTRRSSELDTDRSRPQRCVTFFVIYFFFFTIVLLCCCVVCRQHAGLPRRFVPRYWRVFAVQRFTREHKIANRRNWRYWWVCFVFVLLSLALCAVRVSIIGSPMGFLVYCCQLFGGPLSHA